MTLLLASFIAGILTLLAPCILPVLPVIVGGAATSTRSYILRSTVIVVSLGASIFLFTLLLKASTLFLGIPQSVWQFISSILIIGLGLTFLFPKIWENLSSNSGAALKSQQMLANANKNQSILGAIVTGAALGPVFTSCSPTYLFIVAAVLPVNLGTGILYLLAYIIGLCLVLFAAAVLGSKLVQKLKWSLNPTGLFRRSMGIIMIIIGISILFGIDKALQAYVIDTGLYAPIESVENAIRNN